MAHRWWNAPSSFRLSDAFLSGYAARPSPLSGLGEFVFRTRYARSRDETWPAAVARVVNATGRIQEKYLRHACGVAPDMGFLTARAQDLFERIYSLKMLPPGRGLWAMGTPTTERRGLFAALNNCAFVSTSGLGASHHPAGPFTFLMDAAMLGVGVGFDTKGGIEAAGAPRLIVRGAGAVRSEPPGLVTTAGPVPAAVVASWDCVNAEAPGLANLAVSHASERAGNCVSGWPAGWWQGRHPPGTMVVEDSREGWVASTGALLMAHFSGAPLPAFDYSRIRARGSPIRGFGGTASGPETLAELHASLNAVLAPLAGQPLSITAITDVMNLIGRAIVSGDVRQTAEIAFGPADSPEYLDLKNYSVNPSRAAYGWTSNNSVFADVGSTNYDAIVERIKLNGEPGFFWLENARAYSRMRGAGVPPLRPGPGGPNAGRGPSDWALDGADYKDATAAGTNPCGEQTLNSYELCCLVETFPAHASDKADFLETLDAAFLYAKTVTLTPVHWPQSNAIMQRNRRIGTSMSGIAQFLAQRGLHALREWAEEGYEALQAADARYSDLFAVPRSIKTTSIKPSGTVSLLAGATPGLHFPEARFYVRRVRLGATHELVPVLRAAGYHVEPAVEAPDKKVVVEFPVDVGAGVRTLPDVSMWEQFHLAAFLQRHWADNQVSATITFDPVTEAPHIARALELFQYQLKGISLLPRVPVHAYAQLPYEPITAEAYAAKTRGLKPLVFQATAGRGVAAAVSAEGDEAGLVGAAAAAAATAAAAEPEQGDAHNAGVVPDRFCDSASCELPPRA